MKASRYGRLLNSSAFDARSDRHRPNARKIRIGSKESRSLAREGLVELRQRTVAQGGDRSEYCFPQVSHSANRITDRNHDFVSAMHDQRRLTYALRSTKRSPDDFSHSRKAPICAWAMAGPEIGSRMRQADYSRAMRYYPEIRLMPSRRIRCLRPHDPVQDFAALRPNGRELPAFPLISAS
jgi:hypothetical protein